MKSTLAPSQRFCELCREYIFRPGSLKTQGNNRRALSAYFNYVIKRGTIDKSPIDQIAAAAPPKHEAVAIRIRKELRK
ncbi:hypothetical protein [Rubellicoccus peritrichatus]|uniref:Core-binding (CB) domain-containing protein n=1 Tax=Rubellicoccus peritrichatus TaxID=3080537 RepID=A0AAQ3QPY7_9BACT|nr:hypothetical protein [Puniceicoccus sp. CR14]WOO39623.1 hypothetical protein RZN69_13445 [Puniceicoccus sp. CR14]